jgi:GntR family transcriptional regulator/MocR family aminotransferase
MREGHLEAHIRRIRNAYSERRDALISAIGRHFPEWVMLHPSDQGVHLVVWLPKAMSDVKVASDARSAGIVVRPVSPLYASGRGRPGLMLGFGGFPVATPELAAKSLGDVLRKHAPIRKSSRQ